MTHPSKHFRKKFRQYLNALMFWKDKLQASDDEILNYINRYLELEYNVSNFACEDKYKKILKKKIN